MPCHQLIVIELLESTFEFWGLWSKQILSDHSSEFYSILGGKGNSKPDRWCAKHDIDYITGRVRHSQAQGKIERSHRSAETEMILFGNLDTLDEARVSIVKRVEFYMSYAPSVYGLQNLSGAFLGQNARGTDGGFYRSLKSDRPPFVGSITVSYDMGGRCFTHGH